MNLPRHRPTGRGRLGAIAVAVAIAATGAAFPTLASVSATSTPPDTSPPGTSVPDGSPPASGGASDAPGSIADGGGGPPVDVEFEIDMLLGLVPQDEMAQYWAQQESDRQLAIQACMNESGFEYVLEEYPTGIDPMAGMTPVEYAEQWGFGMWTMMDPETNPFNDTGAEWVWPNEEIVTALGVSEQNAWYETNSRCNEEAYANEDETWRNPMVQQSLEDFYTDIENDPRVQDALRAWRECMEEAGHPFASQDEMYQQVSDDTAELQEQFYESEAWKPESPDHAEWQALVDEEISIAVADATCSPPVAEARETVTAELRPQLVAVWQTIDWDLPPVTFEGEGDMYVFSDDSLFGDETMGSGSSVPGTGDAPVAIDLSGSSSATTVP